LSPEERTANIGAMLQAGVRGVFIACLFAAALTAQERRPLIGRVIDNGGQPVAGATVTLFRTPACDATGHDTERIDVRTDERGRFIAQVLPQAGYSAFATGAGAEDRMLSEVRDLVAAGADLELRLCTHGRPRTLALTGTEGYEAEGPFQLCALPVAANLLRVPIQLREGKATVPPLPAPLTFAVFDRHGEMLWFQREPWNQRLEELRLPPPQSMRMVGHDAAGAAVAGATIAARMGYLQGGHLGPLRPFLGPASRPIGTTAADGSAVVRFPAQLTAGKDTANVEFCASAPGHADARAFSNSARDGVLSFTFPPSLRIRLMANGKPLAEHRTSITSQVGMSRATTDAEGWLDLRDEPGECTIVPDPIALDGASATADLQGGETIVLDRLRRLRVQVLEPDRGPARGMPVFLLHHRWIFGVDPVYTDAAGRVELRMGSGDWLVFVCDGDRAAWSSVMEGEKGSKCALTLAPLPRMRCRVVDKEGQPVREAEVTRMESWQAANLPREGEEHILVFLAQLMMHPLVSAHRSDQAGLLELPFLPRPENSSSVKIGCRDLQSASIPLRANETVMEVVLR
jgi:hypothetical protein